MANFILILSRKKQIKFHLQFAAIHAASWNFTTVAVKTLPRTDTDSPATRASLEGLFLLEIDALSRLRHPSIATFLGACFDDPDGCVLIVRELPAGGTLASALAAGRAAAADGGGRRAGVWAPPWRQAVGWALQLAQALNYMHQCAPRVAHGDLGPACLLLSASGQLKVRPPLACGPRAPCPVARRSGAPPLRAAPHP